MFDRPGNIGGLTFCRVFATLITDKEINPQPALGQAWSRFFTLPALSRRLDAVAP